MDLSRLLPAHVCHRAVVWLSRQPDARTAWESCPRGDWLLYQIGAAPRVTRQRLVACACECARSALRHVLAGDDRPRIAIETAEAWCRGEATMEQLRAARSAANEAANTATAAGADYATVAAALAATYAARAAYATARDASSLASFVADEAAYAVADANLDAAEDSRRSVLAQCADIVRKHFTLEDLVGDDHG